MFNDVLEDVSGDWNEIKRKQEDDKRRLFFGHVTIFIDNAIYLNKIDRNKFNHDWMNVQNFLREYCTVKIDIGRKVGKTTYIRNRATKHDLVIITNRHLIDKVNIGCYVISINDIFNKNFLLRQGGYENIWVDDYSQIIKMVGHHSIEDDIYNHFGVNKEQTFIFLG